MTFNLFAAFLNLIIVDIVTCLIMLSQSIGKCGRIFGNPPLFQGLVISRKIKNIGQHAANISDMTEFSKNCLFSTYNLFRS